MSGSASGSRLFCAYLGNERFPPSNGNRGTRGAALALCSAQRAARSLRRGNCGSHEVPDFGNRSTGEFTLQNTARRTVRRPSLANQWRTMAKQSPSAAAAIKVEGLRRLGVMLQAAPKNEGGRPEKTGSRPEPVSAPPTLADLGIDKKTSAAGIGPIAVTAENRNQASTLADLGMQAGGVSRGLIRGCPTAAPASHTENFFALLLESGGVEKCV